jgi:probable HAF family extracellular repeat protein
LLMIAIVHKLPCAACLLLAFASPCHGGPLYRLTVLTPSGGSATDINDSGEIIGTATSSAGGSYAFQYSAGTLTNLTAATGGGMQSATAINAAGQIAGNNATHAVLYSGGTLSDLGTLGGTTSYARGISPSGQVVGTAATSGNASNQAFLYSGGSMQAVGTFSGTEQSTAVGINSSGLVVGFVYDPSSSFQGPFYYSNGTLYDPGEQGFGGGALAVNAAGQMTGWEYNLMG